MSVTKIAGGGGVKSADDLYTLQLPGLDPLRRGVGRPSKGALALSPAQRAKRYRARRGLFVATFAACLARQLGL